MSHWAANYIGEEWVAGENDCWAFFRKIQQTHFGREVPPINVDTDSLRACVQTFVGHHERGHWHEVRQPVEGDAVLMSQGRLPTHVGMWVEIDGGGVLHSVKGAGVIFTSQAGLASTGYNILGFYRHAG